MSDPVIVDLSHHNPTPEWPSLLDGGVVGVVLKATEGTTWVDPTFRERYDAAIAAGLAVGTYHFMRPGDIQAQMNFYLDTVKPRPGERMCLDHEDAGVTLKELEQAVACLQTDSRDIQVAVYSGHLIKDQLGEGYSEILAGTSLWIAQYYTAAPSWPTGTWPVWSLWQYTDMATVWGISQPVDGNRFNGSGDHAALWLNPAVPVPEPRPRLLVALSGVPDGVDVVVTIDGEAMRCR